MARYVAESYDYSLFHGGGYTDGVLGKGGGAEKIYLHVLMISDVDVAKLKARRDEQGNSQHDRLALPGEDAWWIAVDGDKAWPKTIRPKVVSHCRLEDGKPVPVPLAHEEEAVLQKFGVSLPT